METPEETQSSTVKPSALSQVAGVNNQIPLIYSPHPSNKILDHKIIDDDGDVLVQSGPKSFLVSSKVLMLASPVFKAMFSRGFLEGSTSRSPQHPLELPLPSDAPDALEIIFHVQHFTSGRVFPQLKLDLHLEVAQLADKYDCVHSVRGESLRWLSSLTEKDYTPLTLSKLCPLSLLMEHSPEFEKFTAILAKTLSVSAIEDHAMLSALPDFLRDAICRLRMRLLCGMTRKVEDALDELRHDVRQFKDSGGRICAECKGYKLDVGGGGRCYRCPSYEYLPNICNAGFRVWRFVEGLSLAGLWPLSEQMKGSAVSFQGKAGWNGWTAFHQCEQGRCPLLTAGKKLKDDIDGLMAGFAGLDLHEITASRGSV